VGEGELDGSERERRPRATFDDEADVVRRLRDRVIGDARVQRRVTARQPIQHQSPTVAGGLDERRATHGHPVTVLEPADVR